MNERRSAPQLGLALGSGASRGWSHIGVLRALIDAGIEPDVVCGTSVGAMVGASYLAGNLDKLEEWVLGSSRADVLRFFSFTLASSAFVDIDRLNWFLHEYVAAADVNIEDLPKPYAAVCTDLGTGSEVCLREGNLAAAVRASMAMPGLFPAERSDRRWLVDGGLVNPVPVTTCRELGADVVIGVNLNADILSRRELRRKTRAEADAGTLFGKLQKRAKIFSNSLFATRFETDKTPGLFATISNTINIFQDQITRSRLDADPAEVLIAPRVSDIGMLDFQRAGDAIEEGNSCVQDVLPKIRELLGEPR